MKQNALSAGKIARPNLITFKLQKENDMPVKQNQLPTSLPTSSSIPLVTALGPPVALSPPGVSKVALSPILDSSNRVVHCYLPAVTRAGDNLEVHLVNPSQSWSLHKALLDTKLLSTIFNDQKGVYMWYGLWDAIVKAQIQPGSYDIMWTQTSATNVLVSVSSRLNVTVF